LAQIWCKNHENCTIEDRIDIKKAEILISAFLMLTLVAVVQLLARFMQQKHYRGKYARKAYETLALKQCK
jgi:hypothetical protein